VEKIIGLLSHSEITKIITEKGDMDRPSSLMKSLLIHPRMMLAWYLIGKAWLRSLI
jgi:hypothetical protein